MVKKMILKSMKKLLFLNISNSFAKIVSSNKPLELRPGKEVNIILPANDLESIKS